MQPFIELQEVSYAYPGTSTPVLRQADLRIRPGEWHCITGSTGSGKSTLVKLIRGLLPEPERIKGLVRITSPETSTGEIAAGLVLQNPETQFLCDTIGAECAFGLENICLEPSAMEPRILKALDTLGLRKPLATPTKALSTGQKYRVLLAALMVLTPGLVILDEPGSQLDSQGIRDLTRALEELTGRGIAVLLCEHDPSPFKQQVTHWWHLDRGILHPRPSMPPSASLISPSGPATVPALAPCLIETRNLRVGHSPEHPLLDTITLSLHGGMRVAITGPNGSGKSTLLRCLTGFLPPLAGEVNVLGSPPRPQNLRHKVGRLLQNPEGQLFEDTVFQEVAFGLRHTGWSKQEIRTRVDETLAACGFPKKLLTASPFKLSFGQQHLLALASVLVSHPALLLLDDPFAGLDTTLAARIFALLSRECRTRGMLLIWTSHASRGYPALADLHLTISGGRLEPR